jgi:hypothetical protein
LQRDENESCQIWILCLPLFTVLVPHDPLSRIFRCKTVKKYRNYATEARERPLFMLLSSMAGVRAESVYYEFTKARRELRGCCYELLVPF